MTKETSKCYEMRAKSSVNIFGKYLHGNGIDIGAGNDCLVIPDGTVMAFDKPQGNAQTLDTLEDDQFDFVYSSHCLEHLDDPLVAVENWIRVCKPGGFIYIVVPHETFYEKDTWPSKFSTEHKWSFTPVESSNLPKNIVLLDLVVAFDSVRVEEFFTNTLNYDYLLSDDIDQTRRGACAQIECVLKKQIS